MFYLTSGMFPCREQGPNDCRIPQHLGCFPVERRDRTTVGYPGIVQRKHTIKPSRHYDYMYKVFANTEGKFKGKKLEQALQDSANREIEKQKAREMFPIVSPS